MFNKKSIIFLFLTLNLVFGLNPIDFCSSKQQECKGIYDKNHTYQIKCEPIKCHKPFSYKCGLNICARNKTKCISLTKHHFMNEEENKIKLFKKNVLECQNQNYNFETNDLCVNGKNCFEINNNLKGFGFNYRKLKTTEKIDCKCPRRQNFKCGKYCSTNSIACDYHKSAKNEKLISQIKGCGNNDRIYEL